MQIDEMKILKDKVKKLESKISELEKSLIKVNDKLDFARLEGSDYRREIFTLNNKLKVLRSIEYRLETVESKC